jgi:surface polysaccharide O-acyltransferase-like enzyme
MTTLVPQASKSKIVYIDHFKVIMTALVILHHTFITYGAPGGWYYFQKTTNEIAKIPMTLFVAVNQSFFMGFFFFLSSYFIRSSYEKKGVAKFIKDRLIRLGIPLIFYSLVLGPFMNYLVYYFGKGHHITLMQYLSGYDDWIDFGVLWFAAALLLFNLLYVGWRLIGKDSEAKPGPPLTFGKIMFFAAILGLASFSVRLIFPIGWVLQPIGFQLAFFPQYVALFTAGVLASKYKWLDGVTWEVGRKGRGTAAILTAVLFTMFYVLLDVFKYSSSWFGGGFHLPAFLYAMWEQLTGLAIIVAFIGLGKQRLNNDSPLWSKFSRSTFAVYIFHPLVVISIALAVSSVNIEPALKLIFVAPIVVILSFLLGGLIVSIPGVNKIA